MSKWNGCPVVACKNDLCHSECQHLKRAESEIGIATELRDTAVLVARHLDHCPTTPDGRQPN